MNKDKHIHASSTVNIPCSNGILDETVDFYKRTLLFDAIRNEINLVKSKQSYPLDNRSDVELTLDVVIVSKARYNRLIELEKVNEHTHEQFKELKVNE